MGPRYLLVLGKLDAERRRSLGTLASAAKLELANVETTIAALAWLERHQPAAVTFDTSISKAEKICEKVRSKKQLASVPIIALTSDVSDAYVEKLYTLGADDVISISARAVLMSRLRSLPESTPDSVGPRGKAVVADRDKNRSDVFGRVLANAGYDVKYALDDVALKYYAQQKDVKVVVASADLGAPRPIVEQARKAGCQAVWIVTAQRRELEVLREAVMGLERVTVMGAYMPAESVLFSSNEMLSGADKAARSSPRVLYGTAVQFRAAGEDDDELGFTYNVSAGGLYVRTLAAPTSEQVWIELHPPRTKERVRLLGRVAWRRAFGASAAATVPPGFGVQIVDGLGRDLEAWRDGYLAMLDRPRHSAPFLDVPSTGASPAVVSLAPPLGVRIEDGGGPRRPPPPPRPGTPSVADSAETVILDADLESIPPPGVADEPEAEPEPQAEPEPEAKAEPEPEAEPKPETEPEPRPLAPAPSPEPPMVAEPVGAEPEAVPQTGSRGVLWVAVLLGVAGAAAAVFLWTRPPKPGSAAPTATPTPPTAVRTTPAPSAAPEPSAAPSAETRPEPSAAPSAEPSPAPSALVDDGDDGSTLNWSQGYLIVKSSSPADVYATGFKIGSTNAKNLSSCGMKYVRLGTGDPPSWVSAGQTVDVKCRSVTEVTIEPSK